MSEDSGAHTLVTWLGNGGAVGTILTSLLGFLPPAAALLGLIWYLIQIFESDTLKRWMDNRKRSKLIRLHTQAAELELELNQTSKESNIKRLRELLELRTATDAEIKQAVDITSEKDKK